MHELINFILNKIFQLDEGSYLYDSLAFFIDDIIKIGLLLLLVNYVMSITRYYFPMQKARAILSKKRFLGLNYLIAALLGIVTPFCSCSSIPLFVGFMGVGIPLGVTFSFLISSPLINEASLYLFPSIFGLKVTILYNVLGVLIAVLGGLLISRLKLEKYVIPELLNFKSKAKIELESSENKPGFKKLVNYFWQDSLSITKKIFPYLLLGVAVGAIIHGFVPGDLAQKYLSTDSWWSVPIAVLLGVPLYANSVSVLPIMEALVGKGVPLGTVLAFMTAIVTLSLPEALILKKIMRWPLLLTFFGITILGMILIGLFFNLFF